MSRPKIVVGIDLGNSNSVFAINIDDKAASRSGTFIYSAITGLRV